jgi:hypothetical protein
MQRPQKPEEETTRLLLVTPIPQKTCCTVPTLVCRQTPWRVRKSQDIIPKVFLKFPLSMRNAYANIHRNNPTLLKQAAHVNPTAIITLAENVKMSAIASSTVRYIGTTKVFFKPGPPLQAVEIIVNGTTNKKSLMDAGGTTVCPVTMIRHVKTNRATAKQNSTARRPRYHLHNLELLNPRRVVGSTVADSTSSTQTQSPEGFSAPTAFVFRVSLGYSACWESLTILSLFQDIQPWHWLSGAHTVGRIHWLLRIRTCFSFHRR